MAASQTSGSTSEIFSISADFHRRKIADGQHTGLARVCLPGNQRFQGKVDMDTDIDRIDGTVGIGTVGTPPWTVIRKPSTEYIHCACDGGNPLGFLCLKETGKDTVELAVMGVLKEYHRSGIGKELFNQAKKSACEKGYSFLQVNTVQMGRYEEYDQANLFYLSLGFKEFEVFPTLWDKWNPCQIYVMSL